MEYRADLVCYPGTQQDPEIDASTVVLGSRTRNPAMPARSKIIAAIDHADDLPAIQTAQPLRCDDASREVEASMQPAADHNTPLIHDRTYFVAGHEARIEFADSTGLPQASLAPLE
jgi:hypothetical protein